MGVAISKTEDNKTSAILEKFARDPAVCNRRKKNKRRLSKSMIGKPSDFKHTNHIGHGDVASNIAGVKDQIAEITVTFNATNKSSLINRKPIASSPSLPAPISQQIGTSKPIKSVTRKRPMTFEDHSKLSPVRLSKHQFLGGKQKPDNTRVSPGKSHFQKSASTSPMTIVDMYTDSIHAYLTEQKRLEMMKEDLERFSRSDNNLRRYASSMPVPSMALRAGMQAAAKKRFFEADGLSLEHFLAKRRVISLYREILRSLKGLNKSDADEIRHWARSDFERYRSEKDVEKIKNLITSGKHQMHSVQKSLMLAQVK